MEHLSICISLSTSSTYLSLHISVSKHLPLLQTEQFPLQLSLQLSHIIFFKSVNITTDYTTIPNFAKFAVENLTLSTSTTTDTDTTTNNNTGTGTTSSTDTTAGTHTTVFPRFALRDVTISKPSDPCCNPEYNSMMLFPSFLAAQRAALHVMRSQEEEEVQQQEVPF